MKFLATLSVFGLFASVLATPVAPPAAVVEKRQYDSEVNILSGLYNDILTHTGTINSTVLSLPADADEASKSAAASTVNDAVSQITTLINDAASGITPNAKARVRPRQADAATVVELLGLILTELSGALNNVIAVLGLGSLLGLSGLTGSLSGLILALELVVDNLLLVVGVLLDGILTGLSVALAGITL